MSESHKDFMDYAFLKNVYYKDWPMVARIADVCVGDVIAVWSAILTYASYHDCNLKGFDHAAAIDALYGYKCGLSLRVIRALEERGFIQDGMLNTCGQ